MRRLALLLLSVILVVVGALPATASDVRIYDRVEKAPWLSILFLPEQHTIRPFGQPVVKWHGEWKVWSGGKPVVYVHVFKEGSQVYMWDSLHGSGSAIAIPLANDESWNQIRCFCSRESWLAFYTAQFVGNYMMGKGAPYVIYQGQMWKFSVMLLSSAKLMGW